MPSTPSSFDTASASPDAPGTGRSTCLGSPQITIRLFSPKRVRNIFICAVDVFRSEEHTSELQSLMRISYAVFCLKKKIIQIQTKKETDPKRNIRNTHHDNVKTNYQDDERKQMIHN